MSFAGKAYVVCLVTGRTALEDGGGDTTVELVGEGEGGVEGAGEGSMLEATFADCAKMVAAAALLLAFALGLEGCELDRCLPLAFALALGLAFGEAHKPPLRSASWTKVAS